VIGELGNDTSKETNSLPIKLSHFHNIPIKSIHLGSWCTFVISENNNEIFSENKENKSNEIILKINNYLVIINGYLWN